MKILSIGNSFSQDAQRYFKDVCKSSGIKNVQCVNLYIGSCSLERHYLNIKGDIAAYGFEMNGESSGLSVSVKQALLCGGWDVITLQQASRLSYRYDTYEPYLKEIAAYIREFCPKSKLAIHQTWGYADGTPNLKSTGFSSHGEMFEQVRKAYEKAASDINADLIIPTGNAVKLLCSEYHMRAHRDFHLSYGLGRYTASLIWQYALTGVNPDNNSFCGFDEPVSDAEISAAKDCAKRAVENMKNS